MRLADPRGDPRPGHVQLEVDLIPPQTWTSQELHDGERPPTNLYFSWLPLGHPELGELVVGQGTYLDHLGPDTPHGSAW